MNRPDNDFYNQNDAFNNAEPASDTRQGAGSDLPPITEPSWYGVSYYGEESGQKAGKTKKTKGKINLVVVALVSLCLLLAVTIGVGGTLIYKINTALQNRLPLTNMSNGDITPGETVYQNIGDYQYDGVVINKNDGSDLGGVNGSAGNGAMSLQEAVLIAQDSVVEITTTVTSGRRTVAAGAGSGVIIHEDGIIVTNNHVVSGYTDIYVIVTDHSRVDEDGNYAQYRYEATVRGTYEEGDIAVLKITPIPKLTAAKLGSSKDLIIAEEVFAIGNPLGELGGTVTNGIISALSRKVDIDGYEMTLLQTNAAINSGNSGGGLFNLAGELIGVVNAKYSASGVEGLGFAIPIDTAMVAIDDILKYGYVRGIPTIGGVVLRDMTYQQSFFAVANVVCVTEASADSPLQKNDIIMKVGDVSVASKLRLKQALRDYKIGDTVELTISRNGEAKIISVVLQEQTSVQ